MRCCRAILVGMMVRVWPVGLPVLRPVNSLQHPTDILAELCPALLQQWSCHQSDCCEAVCEVVREAVCEAVCEVVCEAVCKVVSEAVCEVVCLRLSVRLSFCEAVCAIERHVARRMVLREMQHSTDCGAADQ